MINNLKEQFSQMIMLGLDIPELNDEIKNIIKNYHVGGVVIYKNNYNTLEEMVSFINNLKALNKDNIPLIIAIDQENGPVNRLPDEIIRIPSAKKQSNNKNLEIINRYNEITANILKQVGVNMNLAPVLDIERKQKNNVINGRCYGKNYEDVIKYGIPFISTLKEYNIVPVVKHYPGHGMVKRDSHIFLSKINNIKEMENNDLKVFNEAIKKDVDAIMLSHLRVRGYGLKPISINPKITKKYLNDYNGLIITDDIHMNVMKMLFGIKKIFKYAIKSNDNIIMIKYQKGLTKKYDKLLKLLSENYFDNDKIVNSYNKIINLKNKYNMNNDYIKCNLDVNKINNEIKELNKKVV